MPTLKNWNTVKHLDAKKHALSIVSDLGNVVVAPLWMVKNVAQDMLSFFIAVRFLSGEKSIAFKGMGQRILAIIVDVVQTPVCMLKDAVHAVASVVGLVASVVVGAVKGVRNWTTGWAINAYATRVRNASITAEKQDIRQEMYDRFETLVSKAPESLDEKESKDLEGLQLMNDNDKFPGVNLS